MLSTYPTLQTTRLTLGEVRATDIPNIIQYAGDKRIAATTQNMPHPYQEKDAIFWINMAQQGFQNKSKYIFGIRLNSTQQLIGGIGLHIEAAANLAELGYWVAVPHWNKGYMTEAVQAVLKFGFEKLKLNKIFATHLSENPASGKVMLKNGMQLEGTFKEHIRKDGVYKDLLQYGLVRSVYETK